MTGIDIPTNVTSVGKGAFGECGALTNINFNGLPPAGLPEFGARTDVGIRYNIVYETEWMPVIAECGFTNVTVYVPEGYVPPPRADGGPYKEVVDGIEWIFMVSGGESSVGGAVLPASSVVSIVVPSVLGGHPVTSICDYAFSECSELTGVTIPSCVLTIGEFAFDSCSALKSIIMQDGVKSIGFAAFAHCTSVDLITIPKSVVKIEGYAFTDCPSLTNVTFAGEMPRISAEAFSDEGECGSNENLKIHVNTGLKSWINLLGIPIVNDGGVGGADADAVCLTVTNVVLHYVVNSVVSEMAAPISDDTGFVNVITEVRSGGAVCVPSSWVDNYPNFEETFGSDFANALMQPTHKTDGAGKAMLVWQDYVAGTDPTKSDDVFKASVTMVAGKPLISWTPELKPEEAAKRTYTTYGKKSLMDGSDWVVVPAGKEADYNFFKVTVEMK